MTDKCPICDCLNKRFIKDVREYSYVLCSDCGFKYVSNPNDNTESEFNIEVAMKPIKNRHRFIKQFISTDFDGNDLTLCEVGAGYGHLGRALESETNINYIGYEPAGARCDYMNKMGLNVRNKYFKKSSDLFDVIVLDNVLEHVSEPKKLMMDVLNSLRSGGKIIIIVPNRYDFRRVFKSWATKHYWQPECHLNYFRMKDLRNIFKPNSIKISTLPLSSILKVTWHPYWLLKFALDKVGIYIGGHYVIIERGK